MPAQHRCIVLVALGLRLDPVLNIKNGARARVVSAPGENVEQ